MFQYLSPTFHHWKMAFSLAMGFITVWVRNGSDWKYLEIATELSNFHPIMFLKYILFSSRCHVILRMNYWYLFTKYITTNQITTRNKCQSSPLHTFSTFARIKYSHQRLLEILFREIYKTCSQYNSL